MADEIFLLWDTWGDGKPFWLYDGTSENNQNGRWIYGGLEGGLAMREAASGSHSVEFDFIEVLS